MTGTPADAQYWDGIADDVGRDDPSETWRAYMQGVYRQLIARWFADAPAGLTLKTDLFEEAITPHQFFEDFGAQGVGLDLSPAVVRTAARRLRSASLCVADLRALPLASGSMARIVSGSSLDHFAQKAEISTALDELARILAPGGCLIVTFDNPHNPLVWLRNHLPLRLLSAVGLVPYFVGATYDRADVAREFARAGLVVTHVTAVAHVPRAPAIWLASARERLGRRAVSRALLRLFQGWDELERTPFRYWSGYYLAVRAVKPVSAPADRGS